MKALQIFVTATLLVGLGAPLASNAAEKPNILAIMVDDVAQISLTTIATCPNKKTRPMPRFFMYRP